MPITQHLALDTPEMGDWKLFLFHDIEQHPRHHRTGLSRSDDITDMAYVKVLTFGLCGGPVAIVIMSSMCAGRDTFMASRPICRWTATAATCSGDAVYDVSIHKPILLSERFQ